MATKVSDIIVPDVFTPYTQLETTEKARLIQSGVMIVSPKLNELLAGGGRTFDVPNLNDLDASDSTGADNVSSDDVADIQAASFSGGTPNPRKDETPGKITTAHEVAARLCRNKSWTATNLSNELSGADPMGAIASRVAYYWTRRLQKIAVSILKGVIAENILHDSGDLVNDISNSGTFSDGVTNFSAEAFLDAAQTMGDNQDVLTAIMVHSIVFNRMQKNNLIDYIPDARGETQIPTFLGREVVVDDGVPYSSNVFDSILFGRGALQMGEAAADVPTEVSREALAGNGAGQEVLTTRRVYGIHPTGYKWIGTAASDGGPTNVELYTSTNWDRAYAERKQIRMAVLRTCEFTA